MSSTVPPSANAEGSAANDPAATTLLLKQRFPALFAGPVKPLKLRVQIDIHERAPGVFTKQMLAAFFRRYTGSTSYLMAVAKAPNRIDLDGQPAGEVSAEHRQVASDELARRRANQDSRRELEDQQRRNRATLLRDFETTTLTPANFSALKGVAADELDGLLARARDEAAERQAQAQAQAPGRRAEFEPRRAYPSQPSHPSPPAQRPQRPQGQQDPQRQQEHVNPVGSRERPSGPRR